MLLSNLTDHSNNRLFSHSTFRELVFFLSVVFLLAACDGNSGVAPLAEESRAIILVPPRAEENNVVTFALNQTTNYNEDVGSASFDIVLSKAPVDGASVVFFVAYNTFSIADNIASASDISFETMLSIPACSTDCPKKYTYDISITDDALNEGKETFSLSIVGATNLVVGDRNTVSNIAISDNDPEPTVTIGTASVVAVAESFNGSVDFVFSLDAPSGRQVTVKYSITGIGITPLDYTTNLPSTIVFLSGETKKTLSITPVDDDLKEEAEILMITAESGSFVRIGTTLPQTFVIIEDPIGVSFSTPSSTIAENMAPTITLELSDSASESVTVDLVIASSSTATAGDDYVALTTPVTIGANTKIADIALVLTDDARYELNETIEIEVTGVRAASNVVVVIDGLAKKHRLTITDDEEPPEIAFTTTSSDTAESAGSLDFQVDLHAASGLDTSVDYRITFGTASSADLASNAPTTGTLGIPAGATSASISIPLVDDSLFEVDESFDITLSNPTHATLGTNATHTATITSGDAKPTVAFTVASSSIAETDADQTHNIAVTLSTASGADTSIDYLVNYGVADLSADNSDLTPSNGTLTIAAGQTTGNIELTVVGDDSFELDELAVITLSAVDNATISGITNHVLTITNDDATPTVRIAATGTIAETNATQSTDITFTLSGTSVVDVSVDYVINPRTATTADYSADARGTISIPSGTTTANLSIDILGDSLYEADETFDIQILHSVNATVDGTLNKQIFTITNDDTAPTVTFLATTSTTAESGSVGVDVTQDAVSGLPVTVDYTITFSDATTDDLGSSVATSGTITIGAGDVSETLTIALNNDSLFEVDESFDIRLSNPTHATLGTDATHTATITSEDAKPTVAFTVASSRIAETDTDQTHNIAVRLSTASGADTSIDYLVNYGIADSSADTSDLTPGSGTLTIAAGQTSGNIELTVVGDDSFELDELAVITLSAVDNATIRGITDHVLTITNDEQLPEIAFSATSSNTAESAGSLDLQVGLSVASGLDTSVDYKITFGTASLADLVSNTPTTGTLGITAGTRSATIPIALSNDGLFEVDESFDITLSNPKNATLGADDTHIATITSEDATPTVAFTLASSSIVETDVDQTHDIEVMLSTVSNSVTNINYLVNYGTADHSVDTNDLTPENGKLTIAAGQTTGNIELTVVGDDSFELDELAVITLSAADNATINGITNHVLTITNDDVPVVRFTDTSTDVSESDGSGTIEISLSESINFDVTVDVIFGYGVADTSADSADVTADNTTVTISAGSTSATIGFTITDDTTPEPTEESVVTMVAANNATLSGSNHILRIFDDDDNLLPIVSSVELNQGLPLTAQDRLRVHFVASDSDTKITDYLIRHVIDSATVPTAPIASDLSWDSLLVASSSVDISVDYHIGAAPRDSYRDVYVHVWVMDATGGIATVIASDDIEQTSPVLYADTNDQSADPLIKYQWHLQNTGQANFGSDAATAGIDLNVAELEKYGVKGRGVLVNVVDSGLEIAHEDLVENVVPGSDDFRDGIGGDNDPTPLPVDVLRGGDHGTSVAGLIAMREGNSVGGTGVAPRVNLIGHNYTKYQTTTYQATAYSVGDIVNLSFGSGNGQVGIVKANLNDVINDGLTNGRSGKGRIYVKSAGNGFYQPIGYNCTLANEVGQSCATAADDPTHGLPVLVIAAVAADGTKSSYSTTGSSIWLSGFGGESGHSNFIFGKSGVTWEATGTGTTTTKLAMLTTDVQNCEHGYSRRFTFNFADPRTVPNNVFEYYGVLNASTNQFKDIAPHPENLSCNYTSTFNRTSSATPTISGVVALMLEANSDLSHWDVRHILAKTSRKIDDNYSVTTSSDDVSSDDSHLPYELSPGWITNAAGYDFSDWYGFGLADATAAVEMAYNYDVAVNGIAVGTTVDISYDSTDEIFLKIPDRDTKGVTNSIDVTEAGTVLSVVLRPSIAGPFILGAFPNFSDVYAGRDIQIELTSPSGTTYVAQGAGHGHNIGQIVVRYGDEHNSETLSRSYSFHPEKVQKLAINAFYGESIQGAWTITVKDLFGAADGGLGILDGSAGGFLQDWSLDISYKP